MTTLDYIEQNPTLPAVASVIWLHGLGASGHDFENIPPVLNLPVDLPIRFIFPHAPTRPISINAGYIMPAWYDIYSLERGEREDDKGILESARQIMQLIEQEELRGIPSNKIVLAGFSQGAAMALQAALHYPKKLAGVFALSGYLPLSHQFGERLSEANRTIPIYMAHGTEDQVVPLQYARHSKAYLTQQGYLVDWQTYPMAHEVCKEEIRAISHHLIAWLKDKS